MAFYIRKSLRFGPLRFNLSKSGVGVSAGIKGFRVGASPRGNYVHMGRGGLYYRASLPSPRDSKNVGQSPQPNPTAPTRTDGDVVMQRIDSASSAQIIDSSSYALVQELRQKQKKVRLARIGAFITGILTLVAFNSSRPNLGPVLLVLALVLYGLLRIYDSIRKTTVIFYDLTQDAEDGFRQIYDAFTSLASAKKIWHIPSKGTVADSKYHAGAGTLVERTPITVGFENPPFVRTNIPTPSLPVGTQTLFFFPDRVLIFDAQGIGGISYDSLRINTGTTPFIEHEGVPKDTNVIGQTWQYVNKNGGPDRRFNSNREIPIVEYGTAHLTSPSGINEVVYLSKAGAFSEVAAAIRHTGDCIKSCADAANTTKATPAHTKDPTADSRLTLSALPLSCSVAAFAFLIVFSLSLLQPTFGESSHEAAATTPAPEAVRNHPSLSTNRDERAAVFVQPAPETVTPPKPKPLALFSTETPLPATLILQGSIILKSKEYGVIGVGRGQRITVIARSDQQLTVKAEEKQFTVESGFLDGSLVEHSAPNPPNVSGQHLPSLAQILSSLQTFDWAQQVRQIPATVIDNGVLRYVPYSSYRVGEKFEVNVYGDPDAPIGLEIGYYDPPPNSWTEKGNCLSLILANLPGLASNDRVGSINFKGDSFKIENLTFEITPPSAPDAYGGFWISLYDEGALESARATPDEIARISVESPSKQSASPTSAPNSTTTASTVAWTAADYATMRPKTATSAITSNNSSSYSNSAYSTSLGGRVYVRGYYRKDGIYVQGHSRRK